MSCVWVCMVTDVEAATAVPAAQMVVVVVRVLVQRIRALKELLSEQLSRDLISAEVLRITSTSPLA